MKHEHKEPEVCLHSEVKWCEKCDTCECAKCGKEWSNTWTPFTTKSSGESGNIWPYNMLKPEQWFSIN